METLVGYLLQCHTVNTMNIVSNDERAYILYFCTANRLMYFYHGNRDIYVTCPQRNNLKIINLQNYDNL